MTAGACFTVCLFWQQKKKLESFRTYFNEIFNVNETVVNGPKDR